MQLFKDHKAGPQWFLFFIIFFYFLLSTKNNLFFKIKLALVDLEIEKRETEIQLLRIENTTTTFLRLYKNKLGYLFIYFEKD